MTDVLTKVEQVRQAGGERGVDEPSVVLALRTGEYVIGGLLPQGENKYEVFVRLEDGSVRGVWSENIVAVDDVATLPEPGPPMVNLVDQLKRPAYTVVNSTGRFERTPLSRVAGALVASGECESVDSAVLLCQQASKYFGTDENGAQRLMGAALALAGVEVSNVRRELAKIEEKWQQQLDREERQQLTSVADGLPAAAVAY